MEIALAIFALGYLAIWLVWLEHRFESHLAAIPLLEKAPHPMADCPPLCVLVPARNEEAAIEDSLRSLLAQDYPNLRVIVADDHSTDATPRILANLADDFGPDRLTTFRVPDLPDGWMGKCHALFEAVKFAPPQAALFLFTDADVIHEPGTLRRAVAHQQSLDADLFAIFPTIDCVGFWERVCFPLLVHSGIAALKIKHLNDPSKPVAAGVGAFSLVKRSSYEAIGGHEAVREEVIDDMALALAIKRNGGRLALARDQRAVHLRMYHSLGAIISGFEKNTYTALGGNLPAIAIVAVIYAALHLSPLALAIAALTIPAIPAGWALVGLLLWFATAGAIALRTAPFINGRSVVTALSHPLGVVVMLTVFFRSAWHCGIRGEIPWRGRRLKRARQKVRLV